MSPLTYWEDVALTTRWGRYICAAEERTIRLAQAEFARPGAALEVGAEGGRWSALLTELGWSMTCTDVDSVALDRCKARLPQATCVAVHAEDETLPCETNSIDLILCMEVFPVMPSAWFTGEVRRVLKPGGILVGVFNNKTSARGLAHHAYARLRGGFDYYGTSYAYWRRGLQRQGFDFGHEEGLCWFPLTRKSNSRLTGLFDGLERWLGLRQLPGLSPWVVFYCQKRPLD